MSVKHLIESRRLYFIRSCSFASFNPIPITRHRQIQQTQKIFKILLGCPVLMRCQILIDLVEPINEILVSGLGLLDPFLVTSLRWGSMRRALSMISLTWSVICLGRRLTGRRSKRTARGPAFFVIRFVPCCQPLLNIRFLKSCKYGIKDTFEKFYLQQQGHII